MNIKSFFQPNSQSNLASMGLLILRLIVGIAFIIHGWGKIQTPFNWMGEGTIPSFLQLLAALAEFFGGILLVLGLITRLAALAIACVMLVAVIFHLFILKDPFVNPEGGSSYELALVYLGATLLILLLEPGRFSLDRIFFGKYK